MKTNRLWLFLPVLAALFGMGCKKDPEKGLTKTTQVGANTFSCKINDNIFIAKQELFGPRKISVFNDILARRFHLTASNTYAQPYKYFDIEINEEIHNGSFQLGKNSKNTASVAFRYPDMIYKTDNEIGGEIAFTKVDNAQKIYSGTFSFTCKDVEGNRLVISHGRFDAKTN